MKGAIYMILLLLVCSCSVFKNTRSATDHNQLQVTQKEDAKLQVQKNWIRDTGSFTFYTDSANRNYAVQLWPKGAFTYSPDKGFTGEAEKVLIAGQSYELQKGGRQASSYESDQGILHAQSSKKNDVETDHLQKIKETTVSWKLILTGVIVITAFLSYFLYKHSR